MTIFTNKHFSHAHLHQFLHNKERIKKMSQCDLGNSPSTSARVAGAKNVKVAAKFRATYARAAADMIWPFKKSFKW